MYAHVNIWSLTAAGASSDDTAASDVAARLREQRGFRSYTAIRTGEREMVVVTVFDSEEELEAAIESVAALVRRRVSPLAAGAPERRGGEVLYHATL
jgi:heme-degrading monooxygenase HmoA